MIETYRIKSGDKMFLVGIEHGLVRDWTAGDSDTLHELVAAVPLGSCLDYLRNWCLESGLVLEYVELQAHMNRFLFLLGVVPNDFQMERCGPTRPHP